MHAERLGVRPDPMAGKLADDFVVSKDEESTVLLHVVLKKPGDGELPLRSPKDFDLSPRLLPIAGNTIAIWKEIGRWVFAVHANGQWIYSQATSSNADAPDQAVLQEIRLSLGQLSMQGIGVTPDRIVIWASNPEQCSTGVLGEAFTIPIEVNERPAPQLPDKLCNLLPADVRAARAAKAKKNRYLALAGIAAIAYLALIGTFIFRYWKLDREYDQLAAEVKGLMGDLGSEMMEHEAKWTELGAVTDSQQNPMEILLQVQQAIPRNSGLRLSRADLDMAGQKVLLMGNATSPAPINQFYSGVKKKVFWLDWQEETPKKTTKDWELNIEGIPPKEEPSE